MRRYDRARDGVLWRDDNDNRSTQPHFFGIWSMGKTLWLQDGQYKYRSVTYQTNQKDVTKVMERLNQGANTLESELSNCLLYYKKSWEKTLETLTKLRV